jgi:hypothetical protein
MIATMEAILADPDRQRRSAGRSARAWPSGLVLRDVTERPEVIEGGSAELVGTEPTASSPPFAVCIDDPAHHARMSTPAFPYGRGDAGPRIAAVVASLSRAAGRRAPPGQRPPRPAVLA